ncbi:MAG TPA: dienelactone hydrolase family protein [Methylomirabilota bacterium]|nr:dienelactone hydrolase family protein [Methylomirabilota bacterium]
MKILLVAAALLLACPRPAAAPPSDAYLTEVVTIPSGELRLRALLGRPIGDGPYPVYIQNHGSMTIEEARRSPWTSIARDSLSDTLVRNGYVVLLLARRGYKGSEGTASTYTQNEGSLGDLDRSAADVMRGAEEEAGDVIAALDYLSSLPYVDKERVGVGGVSLGGLVSVMAAARDPRFKALISMAGGYRQRGYRGVDEAWGPLQGIWEEAARRIHVPVLILWSKNDMLLERDVGRELEKDLKLAGKRVEMTVYPEFQQNGHYLFSRPEGYPLFVPDAMRFLDRHLKR